MSKEKYHVTPSGDQWAVTKDGAERASGLFDTKKEATDRGIELAKQAQTDLVIHGKDGRIQDSDSYGNDPNPPRDTKH